MTFEVFAAENDSKNFFAKQAKLFIRYKLTKKVAEKILFQLTTCNSLVCESTYDCFLLVRKNY